MKEYLLENNRRLEMVQEAGGKICKTEGTQTLNQLLADRTFVCLHYYYNSAGNLEACQTEGEGLQLGRLASCQKFLKSLNA